MKLQIDSTNLVLTAEVQHWLEAELTKTLATPEVLGRLVAETLTGMTRRGEKPLHVQLLETAIKECIRKQTMQFITENENTIAEVVSREVKKTFNPEAMARIVVEELAKVRFTVPLKSRHSDSDEDED